MSARVRTLDDFILMQVDASPAEVPSSEPVDTILLGDCLDILPTIPAHSVDLIVTSPPYADNRRETYEGHPPNEYVAWFLPIADELARVLKPEGSFILNLKERVFDGQRGTYVHDLIRELQTHSWFWIEEYQWFKRNATPGRWPNRLRDAWEPLYHFARSQRCAFYADSVKEPIGDWAEKRMRNLGSADLSRRENATGSGFGRDMRHWIGKTTALPSNVIVLATESSNKNHSAAFPERLPAWFIRLLTKEGDTVLDPFVGSGTSAVAALNLGRHFIGIEKEPTYHAQAEERVRVAGIRHAEKGTPPGYLLPVSKTEWLDPPSRSPDPPTAERSTSGRVDRSGDHEP